MQYVILGILLDGPLSLYDVRKRFAEGISLFYAASFGSIQHALRQLESHGWVDRVDAEPSGRRKKIYIIRETGHEAWRQWMQQPIVGSDAEPTMLARIYLLGRLPPAERSTCLAVLRARVDDDAERLVALAEVLETTEIPNSAHEVYRYQRATLDYGMRAHALAAQWLDELEKK